jgi:hypothetical protein
VTTGRLFTVSAARNSLTTAFHDYFGEGDLCALDTTYRFNTRIGEVANGFIQQNPHQLNKPLNSLSAGDKNAVTLLAVDQLDALLDKLSGYATPEIVFWCWRVITMANPPVWKKPPPAGPTAARFYDHSCQ